MKQFESDFFLIDKNFSISKERLNTVARNKKTLYVTGIQDVNTVVKYFNKYDCDHIYFGANASFDVCSEDECIHWESMIFYFLRKDILCSLEIPVDVNTYLTDSNLNEFHNFIPLIKVSIPNLHLWNYNTSLKLDDSVKADSFESACYNVYQSDDNNYELFV